MILYGIDEWIDLYEVMKHEAKWRWTYDPSCVLHNWFPTPHNGWIPMGKTKIFKFLKKVYAHPFFLHFGKFSLPKIMLNGSHVAM